MKPMSPKVCQLGCVTSVYNCAQSTVIQDPSCWPGSDLMTRCAARARLHQFPRGSRAPRPAAPREVETPRRARPRLQSARACTELVPGPGLEMTPPCAAAELSSEATFYLRVKQRPTCMMVFIHLFISVRQLSAWQYTISLFLLLLWHFSISKRNI